MSIQAREWTVKSMLEWATDYFAQRNIPEPRLSIEWLLAEVLGIKRLDLYLSFDRPLATAELNALRPLVKRRANHEPLQYITGFTHFLNTKITVNPHVLVPRLETEQLVEIILQEHTATQGVKVLDIGTGSGCIAIALKKERPSWRVSGFDNSKDALELARQNAAQNKTEVTFAQGDFKRGMPAQLDATYDIIVSNPPYILPKEKSTLATQVSGHEPSGALFCNDVEKMYQELAHRASKNLAARGWFYGELNARYAEKILSVFTPQTWSAELRKDYAGKPRFVRAQLLG